MHFASDARRRGATSIHKRRNSVQAACWRDLTTGITRMFRSDWKCPCFAFIDARVGVGFMGVCQTKPRRIYFQRTDPGAETV